MKQSTNPRTDVPPRLYPFLAYASTLVASSLDLERTLRRIVRIPIPSLGTWCALHLLDEQDVLQYAQAAGDNPAEATGAAALWQLALEADPDVRARLSEVLRTNEPAVVTTTPTPSQHPAHALFEAARLVDLRSLVLVPMYSRGHAVGLMVIGSRGRRRYHASEVALAHAYALRAAASLDHARSYTQLRDLLQARTAAVTNIIHDLRTPLTVVKGRAQALRRALPRIASEIEATRVRTMDDGLAAIDSAVTSLAEMIADLLDLARGTPNMAPALHMQTTDLVAVTQRLVQAHQQLAPDHQIEIVTPSPGELVASFDARKVERALSNLLANAIKYSPQGGKITVSLARQADSEYETRRTVEWVVVQVSDQGVGICQADLTRIFEPFYRGANVRDQTVGTGVGLAAVRQIAEQHGGTIAVESVVGAGTTFTLRLPFVAPQESLACLGKFNDNGPFSWMGLSLQSATV
jgi:signal transduction histidine kinase